MGKHAILAPSASSRWMLCPGSVELSADVIEPPAGEAAQRGNAMHAVAERMLRHEHVGEHDLIDEEAKIVETYVDTVRALANREIDQLGVETKVRLPHISPLLWGTCDAYVWFVEGRSLVVADFKTGWHPVSPVANWQMITYAEGILTTYKDATALVNEVSLAIVQPRLRTVLSVWRLAFTSFKQYVRRLAQGADACETMPDVRIPGAVQCAFCPAKDKCPEHDATGRLSVSPFISDTNDRLTYLEALVANASVIRGALRQAEDTIKTKPDGALQMRTAEFVMWTKQGREAAQEMFGDAIMRGGRMMAPRLASKQLDITDELFTRWTERRTRVVEVTIGG